MLRATSKPAVPPAVRTTTIAMLVATAVVLVVTSAGCFKPDRESLERRRAEALRKQRMVAPAEQSENRAGARAGWRLSEEERALVVAKVDGRPITLGDLERSYHALPEHLRRSYASPERMRQFLDSVVDMQTMAAEARRQGLDRSPGVLLPVKLAMAKAFLRSHMHDRLSLEPVTDADVAREYEAHPERYRTPVVVRVSQLVTVVEEQAKALRARIIEEGGDDPTLRAEAFRRAVARFSQDDATRADEGRMGEIASSAVGSGGDRDGAEADESPYPVALRDAALALERVGELSEVIPIGSRYHVLLLEARRGGQLRPLPEVDVSIRARLHRERQKAAVERFVAALETNTTITVDENVLALLAGDGTADSGAAVDAAPAGAATVGPRGRAEEPGDAEGVKK